MAAESPRKKLRFEATCPNCLDYFTNPVILDCGHNVCQSCILWHEVESSPVPTCPQCNIIVKPQSFKANWQLAKMVLIAKELSGEGKLDPPGEKCCKMHREPLKLFCQEDQTAICVVCDKAKEHREHLVVPVEEAAQPYQIWKCQEILKERKEKVLAFKAETERESQDLLNQAKAAKGKMVAEFRRLRQVLEEQEQLLLAQMDETEKGILAKREEHLAKISEDLSSLERLIGEMKEKRQQPANELLQYVGSVLQRYENDEMAKSIIIFPSSLKWGIWDFCDLSFFLEGVRGILISGLHLQRESITLDPDTANPWLFLSGDYRSVKVGDEAQYLPRNPERFDTCFYVLGKEGFAAGRHVWEVIVGREEAWCVGVARRSMKRKEDVGYGPEAGIWCIGKWGGGYCTFEPPEYPPLILKEQPTRIRVSLNCEGKQVAFYDANSTALLHVFAEVAFSGETLLPFFYVDDKAQITTCSKSS